MTDLPLRVWLSLALVALAALAVALVGSGLAAAAIALGFGGGAVLIASRGEQPEPIADATPAAPTIALGAALDAIAEPVLILRDNRITLANRSARDLLGEKIVGEVARTAIRHPAAAGPLSAPLPDGEPAAPIELVGLGTLDKRWQMRVAPIGGGARIVHLVDQTGNYAAERMRVDFVANASHELRTPLASILGYVETLGDEAGEVPALRQRFLKIVLDEARRMQRLVEDLMSLSRIEAEKYRAPSEPIDLGRLVEEVRAELADGHAARDRAIESDVLPSLPPVLGDRAQLSQMLHNLAGNAIKYGAAGTPVRITLARDGTRMLRLTVEDRGEGIAPDHLPRLTERFYRVDAGRSRSLGGTGLGLALVKHIVERHRGRLDIASTLGQGTRVTVTLPAADVIKP
jgi:two-component system phosphate regulon sensor histidine kinase PhoR